MNAKKLADAISCDFKWDQLAFISWNAFLHGAPVWTSEIAKELSLKPELLIHLSYGIARQGNLDFALKIAENIACAVIRLI